MALGHRDIDRLAYRATRMVQRRRHISELHEVAEVLDRGIAPALIENADEGRAIDRHEDRVVAADRDRALGVARILHEFAWRRLDERADQALGQTHPVAF